MDCFKFQRIDLLVMGLVAAVVARIESDQFVALLRTLVEAESFKTMCQAAITSYRCNQRSKLGSPSSLYHSRPGQYKQNTQYTTWIYIYNYILYYIIIIYECIYTHYIKWLVSKTPGCFGPSVGVVIKAQSNFATSYCVFYVVPPEFAICQ